MAPTAHTIGPIPTALGRTAASLPDGKSAGQAFAVHQDLAGSAFHPGLPGLFFLSFYSSTSFASSTGCLRFSGQLRLAFPFILWPMPWRTGTGEVAAFHAGQAVLVHQAGVAKPTSPEL